MIAAYTRSSTTGDSTEESIIDKWLAAQGRSVEFWYREDGKPGPALAKLKADAAARKFTMLVVYSIDRITRSAVDWVELTNMLEESGVAVTVIHGSPYERDRSPAIEYADQLFDHLCWALHQLQGDSGTGHTIWEEHPEYMEALKTVERLGGDPRVSVPGNLLAEDN